MNKNYNLIAILIAVFSVIIVYNCSGREDSGSNSNACANVTGFEVIQTNDLLSFTIQSDLPGPYEIAFGQTQNGEPTQSIIINDKTFTKNINNFDSNILVAGKSYTFKIRRVCSSSSSSSWGFQKYLTINGNFCKTPQNLQVNSLYNKITWDVNTYYNGQSPTYYQLQYGDSGFSIGSGTIIDSNVNYYYAPFIDGKKYDIYVRSYCSGAAGWGSWVGPITFLSSLTTACVKPTFVNYQLQQSSTITSRFGATITWENDGFSTYEVALSDTRSLPPAGTTTLVKAPGGIYYGNLDKYFSYFFFVRKVCGDNKYSEYYGPYEIKWKN